MITEEDTIKKLKKYPAGDIVEYITKKHNDLGYTDGQFWDRQHLSNELGKIGWELREYLDHAWKGLRA